jgi:hypothetical protein
MKISASVQAPGRGRKFSRGPSLVGETPHGPRCEPKFAVGDRVKIQIPFCMAYGYFKDEEGTLVRYGVCMSDIHTHTDTQIPLPNKVLMSAVSAFRIVKPGVGPGHRGKAWAVLVHLSNPHMRDLVPKINAQMNDPYHAEFFDSNLVLCSQGRQGQLRLPRQMTRSHF